MRIAVITPINKEDYLTNTVLDGLAQLTHEYKISKDEIAKGMRGEFVKFARECDLIIFCWGKKVKRWRFFDFENTDYKLAEEINQWGKTVFVDGSELGGDRRYTQVGKINEEMLRKCKAYLRREKPYPAGVTPLPFGIESKYIKWHEGVKKDIDFFCIFGPGTYAPLRAACTAAVRDFCDKNNFVCATERMPNNEFLDILARSKVGVSVGGGGFDTARFWEILGNNCLLMTESIDIYPDNGQDELDYSRITQFASTQDFKNKLQQMGEYLRTQYPPANLEGEYREILARHSSLARLETILQVAHDKAIITTTNVV